VGQLGGKHKQHGPNYSDERLTGKNLDLTEREVPLGLNNGGEPKPEALGVKGLWNSARVQSS
jgi:hypothetical protein